MRLFGPQSQGRAAHKYGCLGLVVLCLAAGTAIRLVRIFTKQAPPASPSKITRLTDTRSVVAPPERRRIVEDPVSFYREYRLLPMVVDGPSGIIDGAIVAQLSPDSLFATAGLREGDRITEINGAAVRRVDQLTSLVQTIAASQSLKLVVLRNESRIEYVIDFP